MKIALLHAAFFDRDLAIERRRQTKHHGAFHLLRDVVGVDGGAAVHHTHHAVHADGLVGGHRDLGHLGHDGAKALVQRHAARGLGAVGGGLHGRAPARQLGRALEHPQVARVLLQERGAKGHGVLRRSMCGLVDKALFEKGLVRVPHGTPKAHRHGLIHDDMANARMRPFIGLVKRAFAGGLVGAASGQAKQTVQHLRGDGRARRHVVPGGELALGVEAGLEARHRGGAVKVVGGVLTARPEGLHRHSAHGLGDGCGLADEVHVQAATKAAAQHLHTQVHGGLLDAQRQGGGATRQVRHLRGRPDRGQAVLEQHGAVLRFQGGVGQIRRAVLGAHGLGGGGQCRLHIARAVVAKAVVVVQGLRHAVDRAGAVETGGGHGFIPLHVHCLDGLHGVPGRVGHRHHRGRATVVAGHLQHVLHAGQLERGCAVHGRHRAAQRGTHAHAGVEQAGLHHVQPELSGAVDLGRGLQAPGGLAHQRELRRCLERRRAGQGLRGGGRGQFTKARFFARGMAEHAGRHAHLAGRHAPGLRCRTHQHGAGRSASLAHRQPQVLQAAGAAGHHHADLTHGLGREVAGHALEGAVAVGVKGQ